MHRRDLVTLAQLRIAVGFLGEKDQFGWWPSAVWSGASMAFLAPSFPRSFHLARYEAVCLAARRGHDERVGLGNVLHLFRLPDDVEQFLHDIVRSPEDGEFSMLTSSEAALEALELIAASSSSTVKGPYRLGSLAETLSRRTWVEAAGLYLNAFALGHQVHPYLADR